MIDSYSVEIRVSKSEWARATTIPLSVHKLYGTGTGNDLIHAKLTTDEHGWFDTIIANNNIAPIAL